MRLTRKKAMRMGPALSISDIESPSRIPPSKTECNRNHRWATSKFERVCYRCGRVEECDPVTRKWSGLNYHNTQNEVAT